MPKKNKKKVIKSAKRNRGEGMTIPASLLISNRDNVQHLENPVKSNYDQNEYRTILLPNGLKVALIASPSNDGDLDPDLTGYVPYKEASFYLCVNVGTLSNPRRVPGVSSVLSRTFLDPLFKSKFQASITDERLKNFDPEVEEHWEETRFSFFVNHCIFHDALKAFARPFISLAPTRDHVEMERKILENDGEDFLEGFMESRNHTSRFTKLATTRHPIKTVDNRFYDSACPVNKDKLYREVMKFCKRHYSANRMTVVLKAELPLDTLETYAIECFSNIPNNGSPPPTFEPHNFTNSFDISKFRRIWSVSADSRDLFGYRMEVHWIMPPSRWLYKTKSLEYLASILSDVGAGTLRDYLIKKKWAKHVVAKVRKTTPWNTSLYSTFTISIKLTIKGNSRIIEILEAIYSYINLMKRAGPKPEIYDKIRMTEDAKFRYVDDDDYNMHDSIDDVISDDSIDYMDYELPLRAENMHLYEPADYITGPHLYYTYDPISITTCMELMAPEKGCVFINNEKFRLTIGNNQFSYENTIGESIEIPEYLIDRWKTIEPLTEFEYPTINRYWSDNFEIIDAPKTYSKYPVVVHSDVLSEIWYKFDPTVRAPTCNMNFCYTSPLLFESVENAVMFDLFEAVLNMLLRDELKSAKKAGLYGSIHICGSGLLIRVHGFVQKLPLLIETISKFVPESHDCLTNELFEQQRLELYRKYSMTFCYSGAIVVDLEKSILAPGRWPTMDKRNMLRSITFDKMQHFMKRFTDHVYIKCLVQGNISKLNAIETARKGVTMSKCGAFLPNTMPQRLINEIPRGKTRCEVKVNRPAKQSKPTSLNYYQFDTFSVKEAVLIKVLEIIVRYPRFAKLLKLMMGRKVPDYARSLDYGVNNCTFVFHIYENSTTNVDEIEPIDRRHLKKFAKAFTDDDWQCIKKILSHSRIGFIENSQEEFEANWNEIIHSEYTFDRRSRELDVITDLKAKDFLDWITRVADDDSNLRKLSITVTGALSQLELKAVIDAINRGNNSENRSMIPLIPFEYLTGSGKDAEETPGTFITDIVKYKSELGSSRTNGRDK